MFCLLQGSSTGLDALSDEVLLNELADRGLETLLERAMDQNKVPDSRRDAIRAPMALRTLDDPASGLTALQQRELLLRVAKGMEATLPTISDPVLLQKQAVLLLTRGVVQRDLNLLEYWGEHLAVQAQLRPIAEVVSKMLRRAEELAQAAAEEAQNRIRSPEDSAARRFEQMDQLAQTARYTRHLSDYMLALSMDRADAKRAALCREALEHLAEYDTEDNPERALLRVRMGKLALAGGDLARARELFDAVLAGSSPPPVQYEARFFRALVEVLSRNLPAAGRRIEELADWQQEAFGDDPASSAGADAALSMLRYRLHSASAEIAGTPEERDKASAEAVAELLKLVNDRPDLRDLVFDQLARQLPRNADLKSLPVLSLRALLSRADRERLLPANHDPTVLRAGLGAATELLRRGDEVEPELRSEARILTGLLHEKLDEPVEAASAYLDFVEADRASPRAGDALNAAQEIVGRLRNERPEDPAVASLYARFLPVALAKPFERLQFAFEYGRLLQTLGRYDEAAEWYRKIPRDDPRRMRGSLLLLLSLRQRLDTIAANDPVRSTLVNDLQSTADAFLVESGRAVQTATDPDQQATIKSLQARARVLAAEVARSEFKAPQRAIELLAGVEQLVGEGGDDLLAEAMLIRVQALTELGRNSEATGELVRLLGATDGKRGADIVYSLLEKLNRDFDRATADGDRELASRLASDRARLSRFLVDWAREHPDEGIRRFTYSYAVFDAETRRVAAELQPPGEARDRAMKEALEAFEALQAPDMFQSYLRTLNESEREATKYDRAVLLGLGRIRFALGEYAEAKSIFARLLAERTLGGPIVRVVENGIERDADNDPYWEAVLRVIQCNRELGVSLQESATFLKRQWVQFGARTGGTRWKSEFERLRAELIPDFQPERMP
jgi:tetratricopeptide (TPR) repeat protein